MNSLQQCYLAVDLVSLSWDDADYIQILVFRKHILHIQVIKRENDQLSIIHPIFKRAGSIVRLQRRFVNHTSHAPLHGAQTASRRACASARSYASALVVPAGLQLILRQRGAKEPLGRCDPPGRCDTTRRS